MSGSENLSTKWVYKPQKGTFGGINRPISGVRSQKSLPRGEHPFQLYSLATPNGVKVTIMFEELLELGIREAEYDAYPINILEEEQFGSDFVKLNPNSKIPALLDLSGSNEVRVFESGSILLHLAEKFGKFLEQDSRTEILNWLFWQMSSAPYVGGGFGHFYAYAPEEIPYCIDRFTMETKRQLDLLDKQLAKNEYIAGEIYSVADIAIFPWYGGLVLDDMYQASEFLDVNAYKNLVRWAENINKRPAVKRGKRVNLVWGDEKNQLAERHDRSDFD